MSLNEYKTSYKRIRYMKLKDHSFTLNLSLYFFAFILALPFFFMYFNLFLFKDIQIVSLGVGLLSVYVILCIKNKFYYDLLVKEESITKEENKQAIIYYMITTFISFSIMLLIMGVFIL